MIRNKILVLVGICLPILFLYACQKYVDKLSSDAFKLIFPSYFPNSTYDFENNEFTSAKFELGKALFYSPLLSRDNTISCASCHIQSAGFTHHGHDVSHGIDDRLGRRNSMPIMNLAWSPAFMWDGGVFDLDLQPIVPITAHDEMDEIIENVLYKLNNDANIQDLASNAYSSKAISANQMYKSIAIYMLSLVSANSRFDSIIYLGKGSFNSLEKKGYEIYKSNCASCHPAPLFSTFEYKRNGLTKYNNDLGRMEVTLHNEDSFAFKIPSLRNLSYTAPYMHDGRFLNIDGVIDHYTNLYRNVNDADSLLFQKNNWGFNYSDEDKLALKAFLKTLDDPQFIKNKHFNND